MNFDWEEKRRLVAALYTRPLLECADLSALFVLVFANNPFYSDSRA
jgi:hypothetical protein